jgi:hypothetical protein
MEKTYGVDVYVLNWCLSETSEDRVHPEIQSHKKRLYLVLERNLFKVKEDNLAVQDDSTTDQ